MNSIKLVLTGLFAIAVLGQGPGKTVKYSHPLVKGHGGILELSEAEQQPRKNSKVLIDITSDHQSRGVIKGLDRAALICNQYAAVDVGPKDENGLRMAIVLHGNATKASLSNEAYAKHASSYSQQWELRENPNLEVVRQLTEVGVEIYVCGQALAHHGFTANEVARGVKIAVSAATVNINKQMADYAYLPFH